MAMDRSQPATLPDAIWIDPAVAAAVLALSSRCAHPAAGRSNPVGADGSGPTWRGGERQPVLKGGVKITDGRADGRPAPVGFHQRTFARNGTCDL